MRIIFMGTPDFACEVLKALLLATAHQVVAVYTQAPKAAGRGKQLTKTPVHRLAEERGLTVLTPATLRDPDEIEKIKTFKADVIVVAAYGLILPAAMLDHCLSINVHASLLPRWRGAAPIQRAIISGDRNTGITIMKMAEGLDSGDMMLQSDIPITPTMNAGALHDALAVLGGRLCVQALTDIAAGRAHYTPQPDEGVTYAKKIQKSEAQIDWTQPGEVIERHIRAFSPYPGAYILIKGEQLKLLAATYEPQLPPAVPGTIIHDPFAIVCADGLIKPTLVQRPGKNPMPLEAFLRGYRP